MACRDGPVPAPPSLFPALPAYDPRTSAWKRCASDKVDGRCVVSLSVCASSSVRGYVSDDGNSVIFDMPPGTKTLADVCRDATTAYRSGDIDALLRLRKVLLEAIRPSLSLPLKEWSAVADYPRGVALACYAHLLTREFDVCEELLKHFVEADEQTKHKPCTRSLNVADKLDSIAGGLLRRCVGDLLYSDQAWGEVTLLCDDATKRVERAKDIDANNDEHRLLRLAVVTELKILSARAKWRDGARDRAISGLNEIIDTLTDALARHDEAQPASGAPLLDILLAEALSTWASINYVHGNIDAARARIYRALTVLCIGHAKDTIRKAFGLYLAAKFESASSGRGFRWAIRTAHRAELLLVHGQDSSINLSKPHAWRTRALVQRAQSAIKSPNYIGTPTPHALLNQAAGQVGEFESRDPQEAALLKAEIALARTWIQEREARDMPEARDTPEALEQWRKVRSQAEGIAGPNPDQQAPGLPDRLVVEGLLHLGKAIAHIGDKPTGIKYIEKALERATVGDRQRQVVACCFALADVHLYTDPRVAFDWWRRGELHLPGTKTHFLHDWYERLKLRLGKVGTVVIELSGFSEPKMRALEVAITRYQAAKHDVRVSAIAAETGWSKETALRHLKDHAKDLQEAKRKQQAPDLDEGKELRGEGE